jgi:alpha-amylase
MNRHGNGYDIYDLWDLGEFDQKGARSTKWGSMEELRTLIQAAKHLEMEVIWDTVINHKTGGDSTEEVWAVEVDKQGELSSIWDNLV